MMTATQREQSRIALAEAAKAAYEDDAIANDRRFGTADDFVSEWFEARYQGTDIAS